MISNMSITIPQFFMAVNRKFRKIENCGMVIGRKGEELYR